MDMVVNQTNVLAGEKLRLTRAGYYRKHNKVLDEKTLASLSDYQVSSYIAFAKKEIRREKLRAIAGWGIFILAFAGFLFWSNSRPDPQSKINDSSITAPSDESCNPNYSGCVPNSSSDLDCADIGKSVTVTGTDEYRLDRDGDGTGCDSY